MSAPEDLDRKTVAELRALARARGLRGYSKLRKHELVRFLTKSSSSGVAAARTGSPRSRAGRRPNTPALPTPRQAPTVRPKAPIRIKTPAQPGPRADETKPSRVPPALGGRAPDTQVDDAGPTAPPPTTGAPRLVMLPQKPGILHVYWRLPTDPDGDLRLRVLRIGRTGDEILTDIRLVTAEGSAYVQIPEMLGAIECRGEIGRPTGDGRFDLVVPRTVARIPGNRPSARGDPQWWVSAEDFRVRFAHAVRAELTGITSWPGIPPSASADAAGGVQAPSEVDPSQETESSTQPRGARAGAARVRP